LFCFLDPCAMSLRESRMEPVGHLWTVSLRESRLAPIGNSFVNVPDGIPRCAKRRSWSFSFVCVQHRHVPAWEPGSSKKLPTLVAPPPEDASTEEPTISCTSEDPDSGDAVIEIQEETTCTSDDLDSSDVVIEIKEDHQSSCTTADCSESGRQLEVPVKVVEDAEDSPLSTEITMMVRNIPVNIDKARLLKKLKEDGFEGVTEGGSLVSIYLPMMFGNNKRPRCRGYAFVRCKTEAAADYFSHRWHGSHALGVYHGKSPLNLSRAHRNDIPAAAMCSGKTKRIRNSRFQPWTSRR